jgi:hypothetical protein
VIAVFILGNSITHAHTYVIYGIMFPVVTHGHLPIRERKVGVDGFCPNNKTQDTRQPNNQN